MSILQITLIALFYALFLGPTPAFSFTFIAGYTFMYPVISGTIIGFIMGDPVTGAMMGASINLIYLGMVSVGGETPSSPTMAAVFGVSLGMASGLDSDAAVALAVPFGIIASVFPTLLRSIYIAIAHLVQSNMRKKNFGMMHFWFFSTIFIRAALGFIVVFVGLFAGAEACTALVGALPGWAMNGLNVVGRVLPALGLAVGVVTVVKHSEEIVFFVIAFLASAYLGVPVIFCTIAAGLYAWYRVATAVRRDQEENPEAFALHAEAAEESAKTGLLQPRDVRRYALYNFLFSQTCFNYEDYNGTGKAVCLLPLLKKLYPNNPDKWSERMQSQCTYFNSNPITESLIFGVQASMEEEMAMGREVTNDSITAVKTGLMGPLAGVGDSLLQGVVVPVLCTIGINMALQGNLAGPLFSWGVHTVFLVALVALFYYFGYRGGRSLLEKLFASNLMDYVTSAGGVVALASFGALAATAVSVKLGTFGGYDLAATLDTLLKGLIPLVIMLFLYRKLKKGSKVTTMMLGLLVFAFVLGALGILV